MPGFVKNEVHAEYFCQYCLHRMSGTIMPVMTGEGRGQVMPVKSFTTPVQLLPDHGRPGTPGQFPSPQCCAPGLATATNVIGYRLVR